MTSPTPALAEQLRALLPCPFCGVHLVERGDYNIDGGWNWWQHPVDDEGNAIGDCIIKDIEIPVSWSREHPDFARWNRRATTTNRRGVEADGWRDIGSAPRDGTPFLVGWSSGGIQAAVAHFEGDDREPVYFTGQGFRVAFFSSPPTHWQPMPKPPAARPLPAPPASGGE